MVAMEGEPVLRLDVVELAVRVARPHLEARTTQRAYRELSDLSHDSDNAIQQASR